VYFYFKYWPPSTSWWLYTLSIRVVYYWCSI